MVNPKAAIPQLINAIAKKINQCQAYATDYQAKPWTPFVESCATELLEVLKEKQRNLETRWQNEFEVQLSEEDWEKYSADVEKANDDIDKARNDLHNWIQSRRGENAPNIGAAQAQPVDQLKNQLHEL